MPDDNASRHRATVLSEAVMQVRIRGGGVFEYHVYSGMGVL